MATPQEPDFPPGHPARCDYDPASPEAKKWARQHYAPEGERDYPAGHAKAVDTLGNRNAVAVRAGTDPLHPELQEFSGRTPEQVKGMQLVTQMLAQTAQETPVRTPIEAPPPPNPGDVSSPTGQPGS